ncbi:MULTISPECIES: acyl-CoA dehydrogenase family protein [Actinoalloteichus]|uniref:Acyl-CoA dehydrogenase n=1 Tax=Actinoalloteichus fjordicus TaxID=1612552 RepID=A0AAC9LFU8_9PSEU|nr:MULTISPECIES: acyl-CoA dehydrogenase family protein [Actinoalloteichus]APU15550.1 acyl-CoA dehydrogenase [Actinoalloteichus fjordicus]APU21617.1 acyl-CoA dehydrogenase [Actinoalloteichus sp. GBA129-24]
MSHSHPPSRAELIRRASDLVPTLQRNSTSHEDERRLHDETIEALTAAGVFRMRVPARYGGYESDAGTLVEVAGALGRGDGAASWVTSVSWITTWMAGLFPDKVQDEIFASPDVRTCGTLSPSATAVTATDGFVVTGRWGFISGAPHSHWQVVIAMNPQQEGPPLPIMAIVPMTDLTIVDDWFTSGLRGTGSVTTVAEEVFIPRDRVLPLPAVLREQYGSQRNAASSIFRAPLIPTAAVSSVGTAIGLAHAARTAFLERLPDRKITYTDYPSQAEAPLTHRLLADAALRIDAAEFHARRLAELIDAKGEADEVWTTRERVGARADLGRSCQLAKEAVDILASASGGSSVYSSVPIQHIQRDIQAISLHALINPDTNLELYGRVLCDLEPNTLYI